MITGIWSLKHGNDYLSYDDDLSYDDIDILFKLLITIIFWPVVLTILLLWYCKYKINMKKKK